MASFQVRTDLALEARESMAEAKKKLHGIQVEEYEIVEDHIHVTRVLIETKNAAKSMGKPIGTYITIEAPEILEPDEDYHREISECISKELLSMLPKKEEGLSVLVVGLGNREVTADALGPRVLDNLMITRHIMRTYGKAAYENKCVNEISSIEPGVMAKTGMETAEIVKGVVEETQPDVVVVIDALAARSTKRLNRTIQISNAGIQPGSGVGNHRNALTEESLGRTVIAIGVPTVVDAATIVVDAMERVLKDPKKPEEWKDMERIQKAVTQLNSMYMTGKDVDSMIKKVSYTLSEALNMALI